MLNNINHTVSANITFLLLIALYGAVHAAGSGDPTNPLKGNLKIHDPSSIQKDDGTYYTFGSHGTGLSSEDRITWSPVTSPIRSMGTKSWWKEHGGDIWAPECVHMDGVYFFFYSISAWMEFNSAIGVATGTTLDPDNPEYKWVDQGLVIDSLQAADGGPMVNVIDPGTFLDDDGKWYLIFGSFQGGVRLIEIDRSTGKPVNNPPEPVVITDHLGEATFLLHWKDYYYCTVSTGKCCKGMESTYMIVYGRATSVKGPFTTRGGRDFRSGHYDVLIQRDHNESGAVLHAGMGCSGFFWDNDTLFMSYHAYTAPSGDALLNIKPVYIDADGWLTMDPQKGELITGGQTGCVTKNRQLKAIRKSPDFIRRALISGDRTVPFKNRMYTITGRCCNTSINGNIPAGIYFEQKNSY